MKFLIVFLFPLMVFATEKRFMVIANQKCGKIKDAKEKSLCVTGTFIDYCQQPENQKFCKKEAARADYAKRMEGAKSGLKKIYTAIRKSKKKGKYNLDLREVFPEGNEESYYYIFGVPKACRDFLKKDSPSNSAKLHGVFSRTNFAQKGIIKNLNKFKCPKKGDFRVYAIGQIDDDLVFDIWYVDNKKRIKHFRSDYKR